MVTAAPISRYDGARAGHEPRAQVRLTADRVRRWDFDASSFGRRGYDHQDVNRFRLHVADELDHLATQIADLRAENERLNSQVEMYRHGVIPSASGPSAKEINLLSTAQREAEQIIAQAHEYARQVAEYAREQYENYMQAAMEQAREEAQRAVQSYQANAGADFDGAVATQEALRIFGDMMISHMQAAARHLEDGCASMARAMDRLGGPDAAAGRAGSGRQALTRQ